jgi:O-antigen/teichoic acid export membrane protein
MTQAGAAMAFALLTARWLGPADRGIVVLSATMGSLLMLAGALGVATGGRILVGRPDGPGAVELLHASRPLLLAHVVTSTVFGATILAVVLPEDRPWVLGLFVAYAVMCLVTYRRRELLHGEGRHARAILSEAGALVAQVIAVGALHVGAVLTAELTLMVMIGGQLVQVVAQAGSWSTRPKGINLKSVVRFGLPAVVTSFGQAVAIRGDRVILGILAGTTAVGIYGAAASLAELLWLVASGSGQVAFRRASRECAGRDGRTWLFVMGLTLCSAVALAAVAPIIVPLLLGPDYAEAVPLVWLLCIGALPMASYLLDVATLNGLGHLRASALATIVGAAVLVVSSLVLIPRWNMTGAAVASVVAYAAMAGVCAMKLARVSVSTP